MRNKLLLIVAAMVLPLCGFAQTEGGDDFGTVLSVEGTHRFNKKFSVEAEVEMRTRDDVKTVDRWSGGVQASYKMLSWLKASAGYTYLEDNNEKYNDSMSKKAEYWGPRHRFNVSLTGSWRVGNFDLSLRERWQYTYRPEMTVDRIRMSDGAVLEDDKTYSGKGKNVLRSRASVEYKIQDFPITPFVSVEAFNAWKLEKIRYTAGGEYKINKKNTVELYYRYQHVNDDSEEEPNRHVIGLGYKFRF